VTSWKVWEAFLAAFDDRLYARTESEKRTADRAMAQVAEWALLGAGVFRSRARRPVDLVDLIADHIVRERAYRDRHTSHRDREMLRAA
jgi:hypothetical protein